MRAEPPRRAQRCAIYTRVSTDAGLDQEFNSLDNQREASEAYIKSQAHEGWKLLNDRYDDGGYSGGSMDRPALQSLLAAVQARQVDVIVVYKVDRLTRSLADFAKLVDLFDAHGVSFVSVTQSFNTTTSMGRLTLNVLLSFAQFEREVTAERIRDKIAASKKKGLWMGGPVPLGYRVENRKLLIREDEAETVRMIFRRYLELKSLPALLADLRDKGVVTRERSYHSGRVVGGVSYSKGPLAWLLKNRIYLGEIVHKGESHPGEHHKIIDGVTFAAVQSQLMANHREWTNRRHDQGALLLGRIFDDRGNRMTPTYAVKNGVRYRYYVSCALAQGRSQDAGSVKRVPAPELEEFVLEQVEKRAQVSTAGNVRSATRHDAGKTIARGEPSYESQYDGGGDYDFACPTEPTFEMASADPTARIKKVAVSKGQIAIHWTQQDSSAAPSHFAWKPPRSIPRREIHGATDPEAKTKPIGTKDRIRIVGAIARGKIWLQEMIADPDATVEAIAQREKLSDRAVKMNLNLAFLSPTIVHAAIAGSLSAKIGLGNLSEAPANWWLQGADTRG